MFFGKPLGIQRYDFYKYPVFDKLTTQQLVISGDLRRSPYKRIAVIIRHYALSKSTFLPAILNTRSCWIVYKGAVLGWAFIPYCSLPELEACMEVWGFMEMIHSRSYTHIIKNVYSDPSDVFDHILTDDRIVERAMSVTQAYNDFINAAHQYDNSNDWKHALEASPLRTRRKV